MDLPEDINHQLTHSPLTHQQTHLSFYVFTAKLRFLSIISAGKGTRATSDQTSALPETQRLAGLQYIIFPFSFPSWRAPPFVGNMTMYEVRSMIYAALQDYWPNATDTNPLPGGAEYNHIGPNSMGPLKANRTIPCPYESLSIEEQEEQCYSYQEFVWGTQGLERLESIKKKVDPKNILNCRRCVGYDRNRS
jgi:hypothetical protein